MKNREWLRDMALYDLMMNIAKTEYCPIYALRGKPEENWPYGRHYTFEDRCEECVQRWLNEEYMEEMDDDEGEP